MTAVKAYKYKAFISYSHKDDSWARWLHKRLESYRLPKSVMAKSVVTKMAEGRRSKHPLRPIFRDREELAAADNLGEKIEQALRQSENLIVICSPQAAQSHWVNEEILYFKRQNRKAQIFTIIVDGEPYASNVKRQESLEAFPPALRFELSETGELSNRPAEPLAADLRAHADGKRLGLLKLISGLLGVGLDEIVQRDMQRNRARVTAITSSALATILVMGTLTGFALNARQDAEQQRGIAQARTTSAEELIEFMVTDLKVKLNAVGRLDALQVVGEKASSYYDKYPLSSHDDDALGRRARVFHFLGEIQANTGEFDTADEYFMRAYESTKALLERAPNNADRIFDHAQSAFWLTYTPMEREDFDTVEVYHNEYAELADRLLEQEPDTLRSLHEKIYANGNLASIAHLQGRNEQAYTLSQNDIEYTIKAIELYPDNIDLKLTLATSYAWIADMAHRIAGKPKATIYEESIEYRLKQYEILSRLETQYPQNKSFQHDKLTSVLSLTGLYMADGNIEAGQAFLDQGLKEAATLWSNDKENIRWLRNYIVFILRHALYAKYKDDTQAERKAIGLYEAIKSQADLTNNDIKFIFQDTETKYNQFVKKYTPNKKGYKSQ